MKLYVLPAEEDWICDRMVEDVRFQLRDLTLGCDRPSTANLVWLLADWRWRSCVDPTPGNRPQDRGRKVVTTIHHVVPAKFDAGARADFAARDDVTDAYHVFNQRAFDFVRPLTKKHVELIPYWANQERWNPTGKHMFELREKHGLPTNAYLIGSFQRDTEGTGIAQGIYLPKLEKGVDLLADFLIKCHEHGREGRETGWVTTGPCGSNACHYHVVLAGWRRQYLIGRLETAGVPYTYFERPPQETLCELYRTLDLYPVTSREEGGPQSLIEGGLLDVPMVSTPVGIAEQVLPASAIHEDVTRAVPAVPDVESMKLPGGMRPYREFFERVWEGRI